MQVRLVVGLDRGDPVVEAAAVAAGEDLCELGDVAGEGVQVRAPLTGHGELGLLVVVEIVRVGGDPPGQVSGLRSCHQSDGQPRAAATVPGAGTTARSA